MITFFDLEPFDLVFYFKCEKTCQYKYLIMSKSHNTISYHCTLHCTAEMCLALFATGR